MFGFKACYPLALNEHDCSVGDLDETARFHSSRGWLGNLEPLSVHAQYAEKTPRSGVLLPGTPESVSPRTKAFLDGL